VRVVCANGGVRLYVNGWVVRFAALRREVLRRGCWMPFSWGSWFPSILDVDVKVLYVKGQWDWVAFEGVELGVDRILGAGVLELVEVSEVF
jgi:hypothetical protein